MKNSANNLIILCGTQRCGSTMIVADMRMTKELGLPEEHFIPWTSQKINDPLQNFQGILKRTATENGNSSIKVMADQLPYIERNLSDAEDFVLEEHELGYLYPHVRKLFQQATFIKINRLDIAAQAVSRLMALKTGKNHLISESSVFTPGNNTSTNQGYNDGVVYSKLYLDEQVLKITKENSEWDFVLNNWKLDEPIHLVYEHCINNFNYLSIIGKKVNVSIDIENLPEREIKKIGNSKNDEFIYKYYLDKNSSLLNKMEVDLLRDVALQVESSDKKSAISLMKLALKFRPNGEFIKKKLNEYLESIK